MVNKLKYLLISITFLASVIFPIALQSAIAASSTPNLISNPNLTSVDPATQQPAGWLTDNWGTNTPTFSYNQATQSNPASVRVDVQNYQDGDAKWWFNPVSIKAGDTYQFTDSYKSNVITNVWVQLLNSQNSATYQWLGNNPISTVPRQTSFNFSPPSGATKVTIFHVINSNGYLETSNFALYDTTANTSVCQPALTNGIYNSSLEETCSNDTSAPAWWNHAVYGSASASFDYLSVGHSGSKSVDIALTSANGGEAGWYFQPIQVTPSQRYQFSFWYNSSIYSYAYAEITSSSGQVSYISLMSAPASGNVWSRYQDALITPIDARSLTIHVATSAVGKVILDDFALQPMPNYASNKFNHPVVSIDFDDGWASQNTNALPLINQLGIKSTFYINYGNLGSSGYMSTAQVKSLSTTFGEEIGSHALYHDDLVTLPSSTAQNEISVNNTDLQKLTGQTVYDFATPYGSYNTSILDYVMQYHQTHRDTSGQLNYKYNFNPRIIHSVVITKETTLSQIDNLLAQAKANGAWLIFTYHQIQTGGDDYTITKATLQTQLNDIKNSGISIKTTHQAYTELAPQL